MNFLFGLITGLKIVFGISILSILVALFIRVVYSYERGVLFRFGKVRREAGPVVVLILPMIDRLEKVDLREFEISVPRKQVCLQDGQFLSLEILMSFKVDDARKAVQSCSDYYEAAKSSALMVIQSYYRQIDFREAVNQSQAVNEQIREFVWNKLRDFGVCVVGFELNPLRLDTSPQGP